MRRAELEDIVENAKKTVIPEKTIPLGDLMEIEDVQVEKQENQQEEEEEEENEENEEEESVELDMDQMVSEGRLTNLTRENVNIRNMEMKQGFKSIPEEKETASEMGYFCDSQLRKHSKWTPDCGIGYFEFYQRKIKKARKQEADIFHEYQDQQKIFMDIYFKEKEKMKKGVKVESDMPLVSHLILSLIHI